MKTAAVKTGQRQIQPRRRRSSCATKRVVSSKTPVRRTPSVRPESSHRLTVGEFVLLCVAVPTSVAFFIFITTTLWFVDKRLVDPSSLGDFVQKGVRAGFTGNGLLGVGLLIVIVLLAVLWFGRRAR